jgi:hypothetical protein
MRRPLFNAGKIEPLATPPTVSASTALLPYEKIKPPFAGFDLKSDPHRNARDDTARRHKAAAAGCQVLGVRCRPRR